MSYIAYIAGYKYQLHETYTIAVDIRLDTPIDTEYIGLDLEGNLRITDGYAWNGPSGPTIDTLSFMRGSLVHDALYQLMRESHLDHLIHREAADRMLHKICKEDGMSPVFAWLVYRGTRLFADFAANPSTKRPVIKAPKASRHETVINAN